jgi:hypothetical protein
MPQPLHYPWFDLSNDIRGRVKIKKLFNVQISPLSFSHTQTHTYTYKQRQDGDLIAYFRKKEKWAKIYAILLIAVHMYLRRNTVHELCYSCFLPMDKAVEDSNVKLSVTTTCNQVLWRLLCSFTQCHSLP